jgi:ubiquitin carboxyl-terminal hydrolase 14
MVNSIKTQVPGLTDGTGTASKSFVEQYMMGEMRTVYASLSSFLFPMLILAFSQKSVEDPEEPDKVTTEGMLKINCNITSATNYMHNGIKAVCLNLVE